MALISNKLLSHGMGSWGQVPNQHRHAAPNADQRAPPRPSYRLGGGIDRDQATARRSWGEDCDSSRMANERANPAKSAEAADPMHCICLWSDLSGPDETDHMRCRNGQGHHFHSGG